MSVKLYLDFAMYPFCIEKIKKIGVSMHNFDGTCGEITCVEGTTQDTQALAVVESSLFDSYENPKFGIRNVIIDSESVEVKTSKIYKDEATFIDMMAKDNIKNNFNCKVKRSDQ